MFKGWRMPSSMMPQRCSISSTLASKTEMRCFQILNNKNDMKKTKTNTKVKTSKTNKDTTKPQKSMNTRRRSNIGTDTEVILRHVIKKAEWEGMRQHHPCLTLAQSISYFVFFVSFRRVEIVRCVAFFSCWLCCVCTETCKVASFHHFHHFVHFQLFKRSNLHRMQWGATVKQK